MVLAFSPLACSHSNLNKQACNRVSMLAASSSHTCLRSSSNAAQQPRAVKQHVRMQCFLNTQTFHAPARPRDSNYSLQTTTRRQHSAGSTLGSSSSISRECTCCVVAGSYSSCSQVCCCSITSSSRSRGKSRGSSRIYAAGGSGSTGGGGSSRSSGGNDGDHPVPWQFFRWAFVLVLAVLAAIVYLRLLVASLAGDTKNKCQALEAGDDITKHAIASLKRLLREVFAEQLNTKQRIDSLQEAAAVTLEPADEYQLSVSGANRSNSGFGLSTVRMTGILSAGSMLFWLQGPNGGDVQALLASLGVSCSQAAAVLQLHSVLPGAKQRLTAQLGQTAESSGPADMHLQLQQLLYRVQVRHWLNVLVSPLGASLNALGPGITPLAGDYGSTQALRRGHALSALDTDNAGAAMRANRGCLSATTGLFRAGAGRTAVAHLQCKGREGHSLSIVGSMPAGRGCRGSCVSSSLHAGDSAAHAESRQQGSQHSKLALGMAGVLPIRDALTATAWAERPAAGQAGWGAGLYSQPDAQGIQLGMVLCKPSGQQLSARDQALPAFCELSAKLSAAEGLTFSPSAVVAYKRDTGTVLACSFESSWRF